MLTLKFDQGEIPSALAQVLGVLEKPRPLLQAIGEYGIDSTMQRFRTGKAPDGSAWAPKSATTLARHPRGGRKPLIGESRALSTTIAYQVGNKSVAWGSNQVYAAVQQFGATITPKKARRLMIPMPGGRVVGAARVTIPARPIVGFGAKDEEAARGAIEDWLAVVTGR